MPLHSRVVDLTGRVREPTREDICPAAGFLEDLCTEDQSSQSPGLVRVRWEKLVYGSFLLGHRHPGFFVVTSCCVNSDTSMAGLHMTGSSFPPFRSMSCPS